MASPALIDFERDAPEKIRGVAPSRRPVNWEALAVVIDHTCRGEVSSLKRERWKKHLMKSVRENGIECMPPAFRYNYCRARLEKGDFSDYFGWEFRDYDKAGGSWAAHLYWEETWLPKWGGGYCERLLVLNEQGVGDEIFGASILPDAMIRCKEVIFECDDRLHAMLERSLPGLKCRTERKFEDRRDDYGKIDAFIPAFELMRMFRRDRRSFPGLAYLKPDPARVAALEKYRGRTGIAWIGRQGGFDPMELGVDNPVSLQYKHFHREVEQPEVDQWHDLEGVLALVSVLDRVVTVPQTVQHLAGACGVRTEIVVPAVRNPDALNCSPWDYSTSYNGGKLLWYPDAQVYESVSDWRGSTAGRRSSAGASE